MTVGAKTVTLVEIVCRPAIVVRDAQSVPVYVKIVLKNALTVLMMISVVDVTSVLTVQEETAISVTTARLV